MVENTLHAKATMTVVDGNPSAVNKSTNTRDINRLVMPTVFILLMASLPYSTNGSSISSERPKILLRPPGMTKMLMEQFRVFV
jgi:hypothetical protein